MSRIGNQPIKLPREVTLTTDDHNVVSVKGPKGTLTQKVDRDLKVTVQDGTITVERPTDQKRHKMMHGLYRSLINNMVEGVNNGIKKEMELVGVGYKASVQGDILELSLGYSHGIFLQMPEGVKVSAETAKGKNPIVTIEGYDKQLVGQVAAKIRSLRPVEPYKGKGIRFVGEVVRRKAGKAAAK